MNDEPHCIRLRSPWEVRCQTSADASTLRYRFRRRFGRPTGIEANQCVWLVLQRDTASDNGEPVSGISVTLNGEELSELGEVSGSSRWDVTNQLDQRNELMIECSLPSNGTMSNQESSAPLRDLPTWIQDVRLEIVTSVKGVQQSSP